MESNKYKSQRRATYTALGGAFMLIFAAFNLVARKARKPLQLKPFELGLLGLSAYRMGRLVAYDKVFETYRSFFTQTVPDQSGAGDSVEPIRPVLRRSREPHTSRIPRNAHGLIHVHGSRGKLHGISHLGDRISGIEIDSKRDYLDLHNGTGGARSLHSD